MSCHKCQVAIALTTLANLSLLTIVCGLVTRFTDAVFPGSSSYTDIVIYALLHSMGVLLYQKGIMQKMMFFIGKLICYGTFFFLMTAFDPLCTHTTMICVFVALCAIVEFAVADCKHKKPNSSPSAMSVYDPLVYITLPIEICTKY